MAQAPIILAALEDGRVKLELLDLREVINSPGELASECLIIAPGFGLCLINCRHSNKSVDAEET